MPPTKRLQLPIVSQAPALEEGAGAVASWSEKHGVRVGVITLGCDKNTVDSERIVGRLHAAGARLSDPDDAEVLVINTCGFIDRAKEESIDTILDAVRLKEEGKVRAVVAMGCLVQRYQAELREEMPEVDLFLGLSQVEQLVPELRTRGLLEDPSKIPTMERPLRVLTTGVRHSAHLKISEGCDHTCAFCAIPLMRGRHRSTPVAALVAEARELERRGAVELNIISQDTTWYGRDLSRGVPEADGDLFVGRLTSHDGRTGRQADGLNSLSARPPVRESPRLHTLLEEILTHTSIPWLRLFYMYPSGISRELVELMAREPRLLPYLDMPIQHGSDSVLQRMRRPERQATIRERVQWLRDAIPDLSLRTTLIVGFPGETDEEFEEMLELLEEIRFDHIGAFTYSIEEGTLAGASAEQIDDDVKRERLERLMDVQRAITLERNERWIGRTVTALVDEVGEAGEIVARSAAQAAEVDSVLRLEAAPDAKVGEFVTARITAADEDLYGFVVRASQRDRA